MKSLLMFIIGAAAGATVALAYAPEKGEVTRNRIRRILEEKGIIRPDSDLDAIIAEITGAEEKPRRNTIKVNHHSTIYHVQQGAIR